MNFELFKAHVQKQAAVAADAARSIRNFDQMAANDDYIHHDELRTPDTKKLISNAAPRLEGEGIATKNIHARQRSKSPPRSGSVRATAQHTLNQATQFSSLIDCGNDNDNDSDYHNVQEVILEEEKVKEEKKKNRNRFMDDLDERLAKEEERNDPSPMEIETPRQKSQPQWSEWLAKSPVMVNVISRLQYPTGAVRNEEMQPMVVALGPLSARKVSQVDEDEYEYDEEDPMENHTVISSAVLGSSEQAELERIRMASKADLLTTIVATLKKNKEFAFILFTLVLGTAAYFYSRHREEIDDVT